MGRTSNQHRKKTGAHPIITPRTRAKNAQNTNTNGGDSRSNRGGTRAGTLGSNEPPPNGKSAKQARRRKQKAKKKEAIERAAKVTETATEGLQYSADLFTIDDLPTLKKMDLDFFVKSKAVGLKSIDQLDWIYQRITINGQHRSGQTGVLNDDYSIAIYK